MSKHVHAEAYRLMKYQSGDGTEFEMIWNSRDGVTPFVITLRSGKEASHIDWSNDAYRPNYEPDVGERIFVDLTPERARELAERNISKWAETCSEADMPSPTELALSYLDLPGQPDLIEVTE